MSEFLLLIVQNLHLQWNKYEISITYVIFIFIIISLALLNIGWHSSDVVEVC